MTTENPTPAAVALVKEAAHQDGKNCVFAAGCPTANLLLAHPRLRRAVEIGLAWVLAEEAVLEHDDERELILVGRNAHRVSEATTLWDTDAGDPDQRSAYADSPEAALRNLVAALQEPTEVAS